MQVVATPRFSAPLAEPLAAHPGNHHNFALGQAFISANRFSLHPDFRLLNQTSRLRSRCQMGGSIETGARCRMRCADWNPSVKWFGVVVKNLLGPKMGRQVSATSLPGRS